MSNVGLIIEERPRNIGNFLVGRLLPFSGKRMVGPFIFIDHMGPVQLAENEHLDIGAHPHIGLSTLTYLFEGSIMHRDSLGTEIEIKPGQVNWMTAGKGIVHSERTPDYLRNQRKSLHGLQIWVALPKSLEKTTPSFYHANENDLPTWTQDDVSFKLIAGQFAERKSPVPVHSPLYFLELKADREQMVSIGEYLFGECGLYILNGSMESDGETYQPKALLVAKDSKLCSFKMHANTTIYLFGGDAFPEYRHIFWNFVATDPQDIEAAKQLWIDQGFDKVPGEDTYLAMPTR